IGVDFGEDLGKGLLGPFERMRGFVPLLDKQHDLRLEVMDILEVRYSQLLAMEDSEPLLDLVHPRTMHGSERKLEPWMFREPCANQFSLVHSKVVADDVYDGDALGRLAIGNRTVDPIFMIAA